MRSHMKAPSSRPRARARVAEGEAEGAAVADEGLCGGSGPDGRRVDVGLGVTAPDRGLARRVPPPDGRRDSQQELRGDDEQRATETWSAQAVQNGLTRSKGSLCISPQSLSRCPHTQRVHLELSVRVWGPTSG